MGDAGDQFVRLVEQATAELRETLCRVQSNETEDLVKHIAGARKLACYGVGREGLAMKGLAMRLYHIGRWDQVSVVGEMTASALGAGDLLLVSVGPGFFSTVSALAKEAKRAGAQVVAFTSVQPDQLQLPADVVFQLPATCLPAAASGDEAASPAAGATGGQQCKDGHSSALPMGSSYELAMQLFFDVLCLLLQRALSVPEDEMRHRHTNME